jgi:hypothetical protein
VKNSTSGDADVQCLKKYASIAYNEVKPEHYINLIKKTINFATFKPEFAWALFQYKTKLAKDKIPQHPQVNLLSVVFALPRVPLKPEQNLQYALLKDPNTVHINEFYIINTIANNTVLDRKHVVEEKEQKELVLAAFDLFCVDSTVIIERVRRIFKHEINLYKTFVC